MRVPQPSLLDLMVLEAQATLPLVYAVTILLVSFSLAHVMAWGSQGSHNLVSLLYTTLTFTIIGFSLFLATSSEMLLALMRGNPVGIDVVSACILLALWVGATALVIRSTIARLLCAIWVCVFLLSILFLA